MPRIPNPEGLDAYELDIIKQMAEALRATTADERLEELTRWCEGRRDWYRQFAQERGVMPIALLLASMVEIGHPFICQDKDTLKYGITECMVEIIKAEMYNTVVHIPMGTTEEVVPIVHSSEEND